MISELQMTWQPQLFSLPKEEMEGEALFVFKKNMVGIVWHTLGVFEKNPSTLPQTETIMQGQSVGGITIRQLQQVKFFGEAANFLEESLREKSFSLSIDFAKKLHAILAREEALVWGQLRHMQVHIRGVAYVPPIAARLPELAETGFNYLNTQVQNVVERALLAFLFMSKTQFFFDCNKRTALLMMYGTLISNGYYPVVVLRDTNEQFNESLSQFYETGDASDMLKYFSGLCKIQYPDES